MDEPSAFGTNKYNIFYCGGDKPCITPLVCPDDDLEAPPYLTQAVYQYGGSSKLSDKTLCMNGMHNDSLQHYDVHNLYGWSEGLATADAVTNITGQRPFILSRSTFVTSGQTVQHWLGDNSATWDDMRTSIIGILEFNMFGIPMTGADICGFGGDTTEELCLRWMQLGAFYPFSRNHNAKGSINQDPASLGDLVANRSREALSLRYRLLPYIYNLFYEASTQYKMVARPLWYDFPTDPNTFNIDQQFMLGNALLISPVLRAGVSEVSAYFPKGHWFSLRENFDYGNETVGNSTWETISAPNSTMIPIHIQGGSIIPGQMPGNNTEFSRQNPFHLLVALGDQLGRFEIAEGNFYWDDGVSVVSSNPENFQSSLHLKSWGSHAQLQITLMQNATNLELPSLDLFDFFGFKRSPNISTLLLNGVPVGKDVIYTDFGNNAFRLQKNNFIDLKANVVTVLEWSNL